MTDPDSAAAPAAAVASDTLPAAPSAPASDAELIERWSRARDEAAFAALFARYHAMVHRTCSRILRGPAEADEATQEAFCRLASDADAVRAHLGGWLHACARSCAYDVLRRLRRRARDLDAPAPRSPDDPAETVAADDLAHHVDALVASLRRPEREAVIGYYWLGRTQAELARELGISQVAVKKRLDRALERLRRRAGRAAATVAAIALMLRSANAGEPTPTPTLRLRAPRPTHAAGSLIAAGAVLVAVAATALTVAALSAPRRAPVVVAQAVAAPAAPAAIDLLAAWPEGWRFDGSEPRGDRRIANRTIGEPAHAWRDVRDAGAFEFAVTLRETLCPFASLTAAIRLRGDDGAEQVVEVAEPWQGDNAPRWVAGRSYRLRAEVRASPAPVAGTMVRLLVDGAETATRWCPRGRVVACGLMTISSVLDVAQATAAPVDDPRLSPASAATSSGRSTR